MGTSLIWQAVESASARCTHKAGVHWGAWPGVSRRPRRSLAPLPPAPANKLTVYLLTSGTGRTQPEACLCVTHASLTTNPALLEL